VFPPSQPRIPAVVRTLARVVAAGTLSWGLIAAPASGTTAAFFESKIRPLLLDRCVECHGPEKQKGGLRLDSTEAFIKGGEHGPVVEPGNPEGSRLIAGIRRQDPDFQMPPKQPLTAAEVTLLTEWVRNGAPWPITDKATTTKSASMEERLAAGKSWWAFRPIQRPELPKAAAGTHPIDAFVHASLNQAGLRPNPRADRRQLIRRAHFDLLGIPPTPVDVDAFERDTRPDAWERLVDRLLASPLYGERWGRHWLDVMRFAQSNGYERDGEKANAWRYRDYVIRSLNADKPYDQILREHLAGDELEPFSADGVIATGFARLGVQDDEPDDALTARFDELDDMLSTTGTAFLGLSLGCARCHEHKFDPIPHEDYYRMLSFFRGVGPGQSTAQRPLASPAELAGWESTRAERIRALQQEHTNAPAARQPEIAQQLKRVQSETAPFGHALAMQELGGQPEATHVLRRGNARTPGDAVQPAFLSVLGNATPKLPSRPTNAPSSGRRTVLADWVTRRDNPLTARVAVNRVWHHHFGRGIVRTVGDLGRAGELPSHPALLDWLATDFMDHGWSLKHLHKTILLSETYCRTAAQNPDAAAIDPGNTLLWRWNLRRLEAEAVRDTLLAISGELNLKPGGRGFFPHLGGEVLAGGSRPGTDWEISTPAEQSRRSVYAFVRRTSPVPFLESLDYANTFSPLTERPVTTVAPQALLLLNDDFMRDQAAALASRLEREGGNTEAGRIRRAYRLALNREPSARELGTSEAFLQRQRAAFDRIATRLDFKADVPATMNTAFFDSLRPADFIQAPPGWSARRGHWPDQYEGNRIVERGNGPYAVSDSARFNSGTLTTRVVLHTAFERGGLLLHASTQGERPTGIELIFDPRDQRLTLRRLEPAPHVLATAPASLPTQESFPVRIAAEGSRWTVWVNGEASPTLTASEPSPSIAGDQIGVRPWGSALSLDDLAITSREGATIWRASEGTAVTAPSRRALESFCLLVLNLNAVVYPD
jgi:mono/diheme cytochrome c family protein